MASILKSLRVVADPSRLRILLLVDREELSVAELQDILAMGQSTISTHLSQLKQAGLVEDRRAGKNILYRRKSTAGAGSERWADWLQLLRDTADELPEAAQDAAALELVLRKRKDRMRTYFDALAGKFGREYVPGRSWKALAEALFQLMPPLVIADLGAGEGTLSQLLAQRARCVIAVDNSEKMVEFGAALAREHGVYNLQYRLGDLEALPIEDDSVDIALFSQSLHHAAHPAKAIAEARRIVKPGGRIAILDLVKHGYEEARELYADLWLGFTELELQSLLREGGFREIRTAVVHREPDAPHFETVLATGEQPAAN